MQKVQADKRSIFADEMASSVIRKKDGQTVRFSPTKGNGNSEK